jgi:hypothetical protein
MFRLVRRTVVVAALTGAGLMAAASAASGNTATFGNDLSHTQVANSCLNLCAAVQQTVTAGTSSLPLTSPANGIVTEWAIRSTDNVTYAFRILRPAGTNSYTGAATSLGMDPNTTPNAILKYPVSIPIRQGDAIGIGPISGDIDTGVPGYDTPTVPSNVWATNPAGQPVDGSTAAFTPATGHVLLLQATVKFCAVPNLHRLKKVAAKQALTAADCGVRVKKKETHKRKFRGKVLKQKVATGTTAAPGTVVPIVIGQK